MKKISIIFWSHGGNVEVLANEITKGAEMAGAEVTVKHVGEATVQDVTMADAVAFGSPSMDNNKIEQQEMQPFINEFKLLNNNNKPLVLFGSFGWDEGKFLEDWKAQMKDYGFKLVGELAVRESPTEEELKKALTLGEMLAK